MAVPFEIKIKIDGDSAASQVKGLDEISGKAEVSLDSLAAKVTGFSFAFNQVTDTLGKAADIIAIPLDKFKGLQDAMSEVETLGVPNIRSLQDSVLQMSAEISLPLDSFSGGLYQVVSAGVDAANQVDVLELSAKAARAGITQTSEALNLASAVVKGYGLEWSETENVLDRAFQTVKLGQTTFPELASNIGQAVPLASALGFKMDELFGATATLTGVTGNTSEVMTQLKAIMQGLADPTDKLSKLILEQTGLSVEQAARQKGLSEILVILKEATGGSAKEMTELFGSIEAVNGLLALSGAQFDTFISKTNQMSDSQGAMTDAFEKLNDDISAQIQLLENRWDAALIGATEIAVPFINTLFDIALAAMDSESALSKTADRLEKTQKRFSELDDIDDMIERFNELKKSTNLSNDEQEELARILDSLASKFPEAITKVDEYGKAIDLNAGKVKLLVEQQRALLRLQFKKEVDDALHEAKDALDQILNRHENLNKLQEELVRIRKNLRESLDPEDRKLALAELPGAIKRLDEFDDKLQAVNFDLDKKLLPALANFFNFDIDNDKNKSAFLELQRQLGLTAEQADLLLKRWRELANVPTPSPEPETTPKVSGSPQKPTKPFVSGVVATKLSDEPLADEEINFEGYDEAIRMTQLKFDTMLITEQEFHDKTLDLMRVKLELIKDFHGEESEQYLQAKRDMLEFEQDFQDKKAEMERRGFEQTVGQMATLFDVAQGTNKGLFEVGKGAAFAETIYNTYAGATAAYKSLAGIPLVGPALGAAAAAAAIANGLANSQRIAQTKFEKRKRGGFLGDDIRTIFEGNFGDGEDRMIIANSGEFIINAEATARHRALLEQINAGVSLLPVRRTGGSVSGESSAAGMLDLGRLEEAIVRAIERKPIVFQNLLDGQEFLRANFEDYQDTELERRIE